MTAGGPGILITTEASAGGAAAHSLASARAMATRILFLGLPSRPAPGDILAPPARRLGEAGLAYGRGTARAAGDAPVAACRVEPLAPATAVTVRTRHTGEGTGGPLRCDCEGVVVRAPLPVGPEAAAAMQARTVVLPASAWLPR